MMNVVWKKLDSAIAYAAIAHAGQVRKHTGLPYVLHPVDVMRLVHDNAAVSTEDELIAAVLHDVVEDTPIKINEIERRFGSTVAGLVFDLTDQFTKEAHPDLNRFARIARERARLATISAPAQTIKYADLIDNTRSIAAHDPNFARIYLAEKAELLAVMRDGDPKLLAMAEDALIWGQKQLVQHALEKVP